MPDLSHFSAFGSVIPFREERVEEDLSQRLA